MDRKFVSLVDLSRQDRVVLQSVVLFVLTNLLWSGHRTVSEWIHLWWGTPAAYLVGAHFGVHPELSDGMWRIPLQNSFIRITPECDAFGFFSLVTAVSLVHLWGRYRGTSVQKFGAILAVLFAQFILTVFLNALRIVGAYYVHVWAQGHQLERFQSALHLGVGVLVFLPALIMVLMFWEKELFYE